MPDSYVHSDQPSRWRTLSQRGRREFRAAAVAMVAILLSFVSAAILAELAGLFGDVVVVAVVLSWMLAWVHRNADLRDRLLSFIVLPAGAFAASTIGSLMYRRPGAGAGLLIVLVALSITLRRFGPRFTMASRVAVLPLLAVLMAQPVNATPAEANSPQWIMLAALIVCWWVFAIQGLAVLLRLTARAGPATNAAVPRASGQARLSVSSRMALQMGLALTVTFNVAWYWLSMHWTWAVITTYMVCGGAQGRGDAVHKGVLRTVGVTVGTAAATLLATRIGPGDPTSIVLVFVVLAVGTWLRPFSYAYWAGCVTALLAFTYGYFGEATLALLLTRLLAILVGAAVGIATCWFVLPIRTGDVVRRRVADALAAIGDFLGSEGWEPAELERHRAVFDAQLERLNQIARPLELQRNLVRWRQPRPQQAAAITALRRCAQPLRTIVACATTYGAELKSTPNVARVTTAVQANVTSVRLLLGRRGGRQYEHLPPWGRVRLGVDAERARLRSQTAVSVATIDAAMAGIASAYRDGQRST